MEAVAHFQLGMAVDAPVLVVSGAYDGPTMCLTAAVRGDELGAIEMIRQVMYDLDPHKLHGMIVGVPIVNLLGFSRNSVICPTGATSTATSRKALTAALLHASPAASSMTWSSTALC